MYFSIALGGKSPNMNSNSRRESGIGGSAEKYSETSYKQTPQEHEALLNKYMGIKGIPKSVAIQMGEEEERMSPRYWDGDQSPRFGGSTPSSSFVQAMNVSPGLNMVTFTMKNGRSYSYPLTPDQAGDIINANSIGAAYNKFVKLGHSNIPVTVTGRSGLRNGPAQMVIHGNTGKTTDGEKVSPQEFQQLMSMSMLPLGMRTLGDIAKLFKK